MSRSIIALAATAAVLTVMPQPPANAQDSGIVVAAPRVPAPWTPKNTVYRDRIIQAHVFVPTADLNLRTNYGRHVLDQRMRLAAHEACSQLRGMGAGGVGSMFNPDPQNCRHNAYKLAQRDAGYVIYATG